MENRIQTVSLKARLFPQMLYSSNPEHILGTLEYMEHTHTHRQTQTYLYAQKYHVSFPCYPQPPILKHVNARLWQNEPIFTFSTVILYLLKSCVQALGILPTRASRTICCLLWIEASSYNTRAESQSLQALNIYPDILSSKAFLFLQHVLIHHFSLAFVYSLSLTAEVFCLAWTLLQ